MIYEQLESEVRAKIFWGDEPKEVIADLENRGISREEAARLIDSLEAERDGCVRELGRKKILIGCLLIPIPLVTWFIMAQMNLMSLKLLGVMVAIGLFGVWRVVLGIMNIISPRSIRVDLSDDGAR